MPRPLKAAANGLRRLRSITDLSQQAFADLSGLSVETIKSAESRGKALSPDSAERIARATGVSPKCLKANGSGPLLTHAGGRYSEAVWTAWKASVAFPPEDVRLAAELMGKRILALVCAADVAGRFLPLLAEIQDLIGRALLTPKMRRAFAGCLKATTTNKRLIRCTVGELRADPKAAETFGFKNSGRYCDAAKVEIWKTNFVRERALPKPDELETDEDATHYAFDWFAIRTVFEGTVDGKRPWKREGEVLNYLHAPVTPPKSKRSSRKPARKA